MTFKTFIKKMLTHSCIYFTVIMVLYIAISALVNVGDDELLLEAGRTILFFVFALLVSLANTLFMLDNLSGALRVTLHYVICTFAFYACFMLSVGMRASSVLVGLVVFTVVYFAVFGIATLIKARYRTNLESNQAYQKQFKNNK